MEMNKELLAKAKSAKSPEELIGIAKENGMELTEESAKAYFELLSPKTGEISDEELENVSGGGCYKGNRLIVTCWNNCDGWICKKCKVTWKEVWFDNGRNSSYYRCCSKCEEGLSCSTCDYCSYEKGMWLCNNPIKMRN